MGKKPLIGAVGLWVGLSLTGCSDCGCFHRNNANKYQGDSGALFGKGQDSKAWSKPPESVAGGSAPAGSTPAGVTAGGAGGGVTPAGGTGYGTGGFGGGVDPAGMKAPPTGGPATPGGPSVSDAGMMPGRSDGGAPISVAGAPAVKPAIGLTDPAVPASGVRQTSQMMPLPNDNPEPVTKISQTRTLPNRAGGWADSAGAGLNDAGATPSVRAPLSPPPMMSKTMLQNSTPLPGDSPAPLAPPLPPAGPDAGMAPPPVPAPAGAATDLKSVPPPSFGPPPVPAK